MYLEDVSRGVNAAFQQVDQLAQSIGSGTFTVSKDNVLAAGKIIESQADALWEIWRDGFRELTVVPPGNDDVSVGLAEAWNARLLGNDDSYRNRVKDYIAGLRKLVVQLGDTAKTYGYTEDQIAAAFGNK
jgi:hypothetical protein